MKAQLYAYLVISAIVACTIVMLTTLVYGWATATQFAMALVVVVGGFIFLLCLPAHVARSVVGYIGAILVLLGVVMFFTPFALGNWVSYWKVSVVTLIPGIVLYYASTE
jgi:hypothetical protein